MLQKSWDGVMLLAAAVLLAGAVGCAGPLAPVSAGPGERIVWIDLDRKSLTVYESGTAVAVFPIASGAADTPSPIGVFRVNSRFQTELSGFGTRFLGLNVPWGQYGIHGTNKPSSIGQNASHGCIRMRVKDAEKLYRMIPNGTKVVIEGGPYGPLSWGLRPLREGDRGADVRQLQQRLMLRGDLWSADGVYGAATKQAVAKAQRALGLAATGVADVSLQRKLGMMLFE
ncbi:MAG: L,D-transpeptidase family protein [Clostridia bacterium]|nr:L,D-transpeptidase family protein [Clostridia bacterium]